ncbi:hypothetical protein [Streptomyces sp. YIM S03343]
MTGSALLQTGNTLVVFDGPRRLTWHTSAGGDYTPAALWPTRAQAAHVLDHLYSGGCLLVLLEQERTSVPMYAEEAERLPDHVAEQTTLTSDGVLSELHVPALNWMPRPLRERGLRFLDDSTALIGSRPDLLLPHLLVEKPPYQPGNLRFARLRTPRPYSDGRIGPVTDHLFTTGTADPLAALACPAGAAMSTVPTWETLP